MKPIPPCVCWVACAGLALVVGCAPEASTRPRGATERNQPAPAPTHREEQATEKATTPDKGEKEGKLVTTPSGLKYEDLQEGTGEAAKPGDTVEVHYTGWLKNGTKFDSSKDRNQPLTFTLGASKVIKGWDEGIVGMRVGGKRKLIIPPDLGYGAEGFPGAIPPNAELVFEVELLGIKK